MFSPDWPRNLKKKKLLLSLTKHHYPVDSSTGLWDCESCADLGNRFAMGLIIIYKQEKKDLSLKQEDPGQELNLRPSHNRTLQQGPMVRPTTTAP